MKIYALGSIVYILTFLSLPYPIKTWLPWESLWYDSDFMHDSHDNSGMNKILATYQGFDSYRVKYQETKKMGNDFIDEHFHLCFNKDGTKTYYKKLDPRHFENRRHWVISAKSGFVASMELC
uniref:Uncharacterized protein n=1 Tax=Clytia hemisphaerica TaxID=252671 RepID=A0A7M5WUD9_9CNID